MIIILIQVMKAYDTQCARNLGFLFDQFKVW